MTALTAKLLGGALLTAAGGMLGWNHTAALKRRIALLRDLSAALGLMEDELTVLRTPLPGIFEALSDRPFFRLLAAGFGREPTDRLWRRAAETLDLGAPERETLAALAQVVGRYDASMQAAEIALARRRLEQAAEASEAELRGRARSFTGLGASLGAMLAVILF